MSHKKNVKFVPFEIDKNNIVKGTSNGYYYCTVYPVDTSIKNWEHPYSENRPDRKKKYIYLHRALLEQKLGRYLNSEEQADHEDGDKENNDPSNIVLRMLGPHQKSHVNRGNHFWTKSHRNKKRAKEAPSSMVYKVIQKYFG